MSDLELKWAKEYLYNLEVKVMLKGYSNNVFKKTAIIEVPLRKKKMNFTDFANFIGSDFEFPEVLSFNYYGLFKISSKTKEIVQQNSTAFPGLRTIKSKVIHFNSIRMEHVKELAPELLSDFPDFKHFLVNLRGF